MSCTTPIRTCCCRGQGAGGRGLGAGGRGQGGRGQGAGRQGAGGRDAVGPNRSEIRTDGKQKMLESEREKTQRA